MKKLIYAIILIAAAISINETYAQDWNTAGNTTFSTDWLGTLNNQPLRMRTSSNERFKIMPGGTTSANGRIAMGNNLAIGFIPRSRLHLHHDDVSNISLRFTNLSTGTNPGDGFEVGYRAISPIINRQFAELNNRENTAMKFFTNNTQRVHINAGVQSNINGYTVPTPGFVGIGANSQNLWGDQNNVGKGPFSLLHLNDAFGNLMAEDRGYRPWMKTGISFTSNEDFAYVGYRAYTDDNTANGNLIQNKNEFNITWSNNEITNAFGSDDMAFRFTNRVDLSGMANVIDATNLNSAEDLDGRHIARFTAMGDMGLGATFGEDHPVYVKPQSLLHMSKTGTLDTWLQITNQTGTGQTATDGLRIGITGTGTAHIRQQEILPLIFYTGSNTGAIEDARIIPASASTLPLSNHGMIGLGNFSPTGPNTAPADVVNAKLDIDGDLRIRTVTQKDELTQILAIDPLDKNRVHWVDASVIGGGGGSVTADNGLHIFGPNNVRLGGTLVENTIIDLNGNLLSIEGSGYVGIGAPFFNRMLNIKNTGNWLYVLNVANSLNEDLLTFSDGKRLSINAVNDPAINIEQAVSINCNLGSPTSAATLFGVDIYTQADPALNAVSGSRIGTRIIMEGKTDGPSKPIIGLWTAARSQNNDGVSNYIGVLGNADRGTSGENIGVWGTASNTSSSNIGVKGTGLGTGNFGGYFEGAVHVTGQISSTNGTVILSDQQFKTNINLLNNATTLLNQLQPKVYNLDSANFTQFGFDTKQHMGLIGQEVELILPNLVSNNVVFAQTDSLGNEITPQLNYKGLNYQELIPLLIAGFQEQQTTLNNKDSVITNLQNQLNEIKACLQNANICTEGNRTSNSQNNEGKVIELENLNAIILDQNLPNPFAEKTSINYVIPTDVKEAQLLFYDMNGRIIKQVDITERGEGKLTVYGENLQNGVYTYSLIADGKLIATHKMVKQ